MAKKFPRPAYAVFSASLAAIAVALLVWDIVAPDVSTSGSAAANAGFRMGALVGTLARTAVLALCALALFRAAQRAPGARADAGDLRAIYDKERLGTRKDGDYRTHGGVDAANPYRGLPPRELADVYAHIDRDQAPERFEALMQAIKSAVEDR